MNVHDTSGKGLLNSFLLLADKLHLNIADMRGQSYDNGANMKGRKKGVQAGILELNSRAMYLPCGSHTWNLVVADSANSSVRAVTFFGNINRIYVLFSSSPCRWDILKEHMPISVKGLSATRWEARIEALKPLRYHLPELKEALDALAAYALKKKDGATACEANGLLNAITTWPFIISIIIWYDILYHVNKRSKLIQSPGVSIDVLDSEVSATKHFLQNYRENGYASACTDARDIAEKMEIPREFPVVRERSKTRMFIYESNDEGVCLTEEERFKTQLFLPLVDMAISSTSERFHQLSEWSKVFGFIYHVDTMTKIGNEKSLRLHCQNYQDRMGDIDAGELESELSRFVFVLRQNKSLLHAKDFLTYIYKHELQ